MQGLPRLLLQRILWSVLVLWLVSVLIFFATQMLPGDAAQAILGIKATPESLLELRQELGLYGSAPEQYFRWMSSALLLDFGTSLSNSIPVSTLLLPRIASSLSLMAVAAAIGVPLSLLIGAISGYRRDGAFDHVVSLFTLVLSALPVFVVGSVLVLAFSTGSMNVLPAISPERLGWGNVPLWILPSVTLASAIAPYIIRMMRATMIEILESEYVTYARLQGASSRSILLRHALPNTIGPIAQVTALQLAYLASGAVVVEYLFAYPGVGSALVDAVNNRDLPVVQATCLFIAAFYVLVNFMADTATIMATPRIRIRGA
jgi:ABC-type dipeptide/oligopeptide/nickel transport systems, permease components